MDPSSGSKLSLAQTLKLLAPSYTPGSWKNSARLLRRWSDVRTMSSRQRLLLEMVCSKCTPYQGKTYLPGFENMKIPSLASICSFCALISRVFQHFVGGNQDHYRCNMRIRSTHDLHFCFYLAPFEDYNEHTHVQLYCPELHDPEHPLGGSREVYANPLASEGLVRLKSWIDHCASDHPDCAHGKSQGQTLQRFVPSRLIRLGDNTLGHVQLVSTTTPVQYVALSYCWGSTKQPGTTKSNISSQKQQIEVSELPQTLQDAIFVAKALGAHYIWIDSLCIVQDDVDDWATESSKMADVYSGAWLVIAATRANDCAEGFLQSRNEPLILDWTLPSKTFSTSTAQRTKSLKMTARLTTSHACYELSPNIADQPLAKRAWAMQERELARRIVHFLPDEILWHCQTKSCCECGLSPDSSFQKLSPFAAFSNLVPEDLERDNVVEFGMAWIDIVKSYADLKMTQLTDMLPALSGIARYIEYLQPGQYIAGVWEKDIALQLSWVRFQDLDSPRTCLSSPSFSWTSAQQNFYWHIHPFWHYKARCTFVAATKRLATKNPYGHVLECSITLRGRTIQGTKLHTRINQARIKALRPDKVFAIMDDPACSFESLLLDSNINAIGKEGISNKPSVICLELFQSKNYYTTFDINADGIVMTALVLRRYASETSYTRVGVISNINFKWFDKDGVEETVTIT